MFTIFNSESLWIGRDMKCHHLTHVSTSGWVSDHGGSATNQGDWLVA